MARDDPGGPLTPGQGPDPLRLALALWLALGLAVALRTLVAPESHTVFPISAAASGHWWADLPLYARYRPLDYFRYPPPFAVALSPLAACGPRVGGVLWVWLGMGVYFAGLWAFARDVLGIPWARPRLALFLVLGALGAVRGLWNAQSNALVTGLLLLGASALVRRRGWQAALLMAGSVAVKLTPAA